MATKLHTRQISNRSALAFIGSATNDTLDTILPKINAELAKLFEDRNILLTGGGNVTNSGGTSLSFSANFILYINSNIAGASPYTVSVDSSPWAFSADGRMAYITITSRSAGTFTLTTDAASLPAVVAANQEVFLIAKRVGTSIIFKDGTVFPTGATGTIGSLGSGSDTTYGMVSNNSSNGSLTVTTGTSRFVPYLTIQAPDTYTVNTGAQLVTVTVMVVLGTLIINGTGESRVI